MPHTPTAFEEYFNLLCSGCPGKRGMLFSAEYLKLLISRHNASSMQNTGQELDLLKLLLCVFGTVMSGLKTLRYK